METDTDKQLLEEVKKRLETEVNDHRFYRSIFSLIFAHGILNPKVVQSMERDMCYELASKNYNR